MKYCIGIDGGGSSTLSYLGDMEGNLIERKNFGPSNYQIIGEEKTKIALKNIINYFVFQYNINIDDLYFISLGIAGLDRKKDKCVLEDILKNIFKDISLNCKIFLQNDSYSSLAGALNNQDGVILAAGTGSVALGKKQGEYHRVGGWTHILGDEGSGYSIGLNALKSIMKVYDKRIKESPFYFELLDSLGIEDPRDTISYAYENVHDTKTIGQLALLVFKCFDKNDPLAIRLINTAVLDLYELVEPLIGQLYGVEDEFFFTYSGSILLKSDFIRTKLVGRLKEKYSNLKPIDPIYNSAIGALIIGWNIFGIDYKYNLKNSYRAL